MRTNYVMIDFESVQPSDLALLDAEHFRVMVFVGANQTRIATAFAEAMQKLASRGEYLRISGSGRNALDFHIAFHIGRIAVAEPEAYFHVISKDTGFDPLIEHLKGRKVLAARSATIAEIPLLRAALSTSLAERTAAVVTHLQRCPELRPQSARALRNAIGTLFHKQLSDEDLSTLFDALVSRGVVKAEGSKLQYELSIRAA